MQLAMGRAMLRRALFAASLAGGLLGLSSRAEAAGAWIASGSFTPLEQRVAVAAGPSRTTLWTSLRFDAAAGSVALILPVSAGAALDVSSDAWFEALEVATAPRVFPPSGEDPYCPGKTGPWSIFETVGPIGHTPSLATKDFAVLDDATQVDAWAAKNGLVIAPALQQALAALSNVQFVVARFDTPGGAGVTPTLRVATPGAPSVLPLALTRATGKDLLVTAWTIGGGHGELIGGTPVTIPPGDLEWNAKRKASNYEDERAKALSGVAGSTLLENASPSSLGLDVPIPGNTVIDSVVTTFFERASAYGDASGSPSACISAASASLASAMPVSPSCPHAGLGVVDPADPCAESPTPNGVDPATLRCGLAVDDLAVALSGMVPAGTWLTRQSLLISAGLAGADWYLSFEGGTSVTPVFKTTTVDLSECDAGGTTSSTGAGANVSSGVGAGTGASSSSGSGGANGSGGSVYWNGGVSYDAGYYPSDVSCDCSGASGSSDVSSDACSGDGSDSCSGDAGDGADSCSGDGADSCSGDGADSCDGGGADSCDGAEGLGDACSGVGDAASGCDCSTSGRSAHGPHKRRGLRLSPLALAALAILAPLRRRGRRSRPAARGETSSPIAAAPR